MKQESKLLNRALRAGGKRPWRTKRQQKKRARALQKWHDSLPARQRELITMDWD